MLGQQQQLTLASLNSALSLVVVVEHCRHQHSLARPFSVKCWLPDKQTDQAVISTSTTRAASACTFWYLRTRKLQFFLLAYSTTRCQLDSTTRCQLELAARCAICQQNCNFRVLRPPVSSQGYPVQDTPSGAMPDQWPRYRKGRVDDSAGGRTRNLTVLLAIYGSFL